MPVSLDARPGSPTLGDIAARLQPYADSLERIAPDEAATFAELSRTMQHIARTTARRYRHAYRPVHAKSHGVLVGALTVRGDLAAPLAQGVFARAAEYPVVLRFSTTPGDLLADNVSTPRGLAVKIMLGDGAPAPTQDFACVAADRFTAPTPAVFAKQLRLFDKTLDWSEGTKHVVSVTARAANAVIGLAGLHSDALEAVGAPNAHALGESFTTVAPVRYGAYVAKVGIAPASANLRALIGVSVHINDDYNAHAEAIRAVCAGEACTWDVKVQLALADPEFPIEDASIRWPAARSPWLTVAQIHAPPQDSYSDARQRFVDEQLAFSPWHCVPAHRPLGGMMRARRLAYAEAAAFRAERNGRRLVEPRTAEEIPE